MPPSRTAIRAWPRRCVRTARKTECGAKIRAVCYSPQAVATISLRRAAMEEWAYAQVRPTDQLAQLRFYSIKKPQGAGEVEFRITVWEYVKPRDPEMPFFAQADKQTNHK